MPDSQQTQEFSFIIDSKPTGSYNLWVKKNNVG
jgi:hypothetical protein